LLVGKVVQADDPSGNIVIKDENGTIWNIDESAIPSKTQVVTKKGKIVKIVGKVKGNFGFAAKEIRRCGDCWRDEDSGDN